MSFKLPIGAVYPADDGYVALVHQQVMTSNTRSVMPNSSVVNSTSAIQNGPFALCVEGVFLWLLLVWITAGTAAIITILVKSCRNRSASITLEDELRLMTIFLKVEDEPE